MQGNAIPLYRSYGNQAHVTVTSSVESHGGFCGTMNEVQYPLEGQEPYTPQAFYSDNHWRYTSDEVPPADLGVLKRLRPLSDLRNVDLEGVDFQP